MSYPFGNVNVGSNPGDGTGDPLRVAFQTINNNFANIASGNITVTAPVLSVAGRTGNITLTASDVIGVASTGYADNTGIASNVYAQSLILSISSNVQNAVQSNLTANINSILSNSTTIANITTNVTSNIITTITPAVYANVTSIVGNIVSGNLAQVNANITAVNAAIIATNAAITTANTAVVSYVDTKATLLQSGINGANVNISALQAYDVWANSNIGGLYNSIVGANVNISALQTNIGGYYLWANTSYGGLASSILGANAAIITANTAVVAYVNAQDTALQTNITNANIYNTTYTNTINSAMVSNITAANSVINSLTYTVSSLSSQLTQLQVGSGFASVGQITGANLTISALQANLGSYYTWANANVAGLGSNIANLLSSTAALTGQFTLSNTAVVSYINTLISNVSANITAANAAIVTANNAVVSYVNSYVNTLNSAMISNVTAANSQISATQTNLTNLINQFIVANITSTFGTVSTWITANINAANVAWQTNVGPIYNNVATHTTWLGNLQSNVTTYATWLGNLQANVYSNANATSYFSTYSGNVSAGNINVGNVFVSNNETIGGNLTLTSGAILFSSVTVSAAGSNQGSATQISADNVFVTGGTGGVILPQAVQGREISITNDTGIAINVYPASGHYIESSSTNVPTVLPPYATLGLIAKSGNNWWTSQPVYNPGTGISIAQNANGSVTWSIGQSVATTANVTFGNIITNTANVSTLIASNVIASNHLYPNGASILTGIPGTYSNANVASYLSVYSGNISANISANNITIASNVQAIARGAVSITADGTYVLPNDPGVMLQITGQTNNPARLYIDGAGTNNYAAIIGRHYNGTPGFPTQVLANTIISRFGGTPFTSNAWPAKSTTRIDMVTDENQTGTNQGSSIQLWITPIGANTVQQQFTVNTAGVSTTANITTTANIIASNHLYANGQSILTGVTYNYSNANVASYLSTYSGNIAVANLNINGNAYHAGSTTLVGNVFQQSAYYETYSNISNTGGNLTLNFINGGVYYATLTANVTVNIINIANNSSTVTGFTVIIDQGLTPYHIANLQFNGSTVSNIKWAGATVPAGTASNTDVISISLINLNNGNYRILGQQRSYA